MMTSRCEPRMKCINQASKCCHLSEEALIDRKGLRETAEA